MTTPNGKPPGRGWGRRKPPRPKTPEEQRAHMEVAYLQHQYEQIVFNDQRVYEDIRIRRDGTPSAIPPATTLPLRFWAVVEYPPDGGEDDLVENRLANYEQWLKVLKKNGLYDGPTQLKRVGKDADASQEAQAADQEPD